MMNVLFFHRNDFRVVLERDISTLQSKLKETKKVTVREPPPPPQPTSPTVVTHSRLAQTDPWVPTPISPDKPDDSNKDFEGMMQARVEALERKYQTIIEQKNSQVQQLMQEVITNINNLNETNISGFF